VSARIVVRGSYNQAPLLDTEKATQIEFYDANGELVALVGKIFGDEFWFYSNKNDKDWPQVLARTGFLNNVAPLAEVRR
jgi:hypothetical protein